MYNKINDVENGASKASKGGLNSVDNVVTQGKKAFDNFNIDSAYVKSKHLSIRGGNGAKLFWIASAFTQTLKQNNYSSIKSYLYQ